MAAVRRKVEAPRRESKAEEDARFNALSADAEARQRRAWAEASPEERQRQIDEADRERFLQMFAEDERLAKKSRDANAVKAASIKARRAATAALAPEACRVHPATSGMRYRDRRYDWIVDQLTARGFLGKKKQPISRKTLAADLQEMPDTALLLSR